MTAQMQRPLDATYNNTRYVLQKSSFPLPISWQTIVVADGKQISNVTNAGSMQCTPDVPMCGTLFLFTQARGGSVQQQSSAIGIVVSPLQSFIWNSNYQVTFTFKQPFDGFYEAGVGSMGIAPNTVANFVVTSSYVDAAFTHFQLSGKYTFFTLTFVVWVLYLVCLHQSGKGVRHPTTGARLPMTDEQNWAAVLGGLCVWCVCAGGGQPGAPLSPATSLTAVDLPAVVARRYNDPAFAASVTAPTFAAVRALPD